MHARPSGYSLSELPSTITIEAQRGVELGLLHFLKKYNPQVYSLWRSHPHLEPEDAVLRPDGDLDHLDESEDPAERVQAWARHHTAPEFHSPVPLLRRFHVEYLSRQLGSLPAAAQGLYPSRPWLAYWSLQAADLLGVTTKLFERAPAEGLVDLLLSCLVVCESPHHTEWVGGGYATHDPRHGRSSHVSGEALAQPQGASSPSSTPPPARRKPVIGIAGGPAHQFGHLISAYAAVCALCILNSFSPCLHQLPRAALKRWLLGLRTPDGGFAVHPGGECDIRASYAAAVMVTLLRLDEPSTFHVGDESEGCAAVFNRLGITEERGFDLSGCDDVRDTPVLTIETARYVASRQTVEGGFTCGAHASEAHGAYTQCGLACLLLMRQPQLAHQARLRRWLSERQLSFEGGFNGRTNKLVDSCYSHWVGSSHVLLKVVESYCRLLGSDCRSRLRQDERMRRPPRQGEAEGSTEGTEAADQADGATFLRAKELFLLDHAQLLELAAVSCGDDALWDRAEAAEVSKEDLVDQFLRADDATHRQSTARQAARADVFGKLLRRECLQGKHLPLTDESAAKELTSLHRDVTFAQEPVGDYYYNQRKLQQYVLRCCQAWQDGEGGLMDKPECNNDAYHTCYSLTGISSSQNLQYLSHAANSSNSAYIKRAMEKRYVPGGQEGYGVVVGVEGPSVGAEVSILRTTNPIFNLHRSRVVNAMSTWGVKMFV